MLLFCDLDLQFQGHWRPLKGQILDIFLHFGPVLIYRKLDHSMAGIYNTYICPLQACRNLTLKLFIEGHPQVIFGEIFGINALRGKLYQLHSPNLQDVFIGR